MSIPKFDETFTAILDSLKDGVELHRSEIKRRVREKFWDQMTDEEKRLRNKNSNNLKIDDNIGFAISYLKMGKFIFSSRRGYYKITQKGIDWINSGRDLNYNILRQDPDFIRYKEKQKRQSKQFNKHDDLKEDVDKIELENPIKRIEEAFVELEEELKNDLLDRLKNLNPYYFEKIVLKLFKRMGYGDFETTPKSGDGGIDGVIKQDDLGVDKIYIQAKRYTENKVRETEIRNFKGAIDDKGVQKGIFVTTTSFDQKAIDSVNKSSNKIILIDGNTLVDLMYKYNVGIEERDDYKDLKIKQIDEDFFLDDEDEIQHF